MEDLIKKLQEEAGLTEAQSLKAMSVVKDYLDKEGHDVDWEKVFKGKYQDFLGKAKEVLGNVSEKAQPYTDKISDTVDDLLSKAKKGAHDISKKAADFFDDKKS